MKECIRLVTALLLIFMLWSCVLSMCNPGQAQTLDPEGTTWDWGWIVIVGGTLGLLLFCVIKTRRIK